MVDYLFVDNESGWEFFVECENYNEALEILAQNDMTLDDVEFCGEYTVEEAEILGYDTF